MSVTLDSNDGAQEIAAPGAAHWGFWGTLIWGAVILIIEFLMQIITLIAVVLWRKGDITKLSASELSQAFSSTSDSGFDLSAMTFVTTVVGGGIVVGVIKLKKRSLL